ncbi:hypothetical protein K0C01_10525 [Salinarchaeum sp. IM2453]|uniref:hypothetical protein n=1 Tax=Salinarchaeum sp. IM2453 TaxID=2862870 RepID=UPI001C82A05B|nr:hypothetical protein [Salinarchaeum sp. IM2453]QZA88211.1 hypothetical protein K0C01_10525 [Salinarchaeum sp. IM2453]
MKLPTSVVDDIEEGTKISIVAQVDSIHKGGNVRERILLTDIDGNTTTLTLFEGSPQYELTEDQWYLFQDANGNVYNGQKELEPNYGDLSIEPVDPPEDLISTNAENKTPEDLNTADGRLALDIETIQTVDEAELDLSNSDHLELLCVGVGYQPHPSGQIETDVLFREELSPTAEIDLINELCDWLETRDANTLLTYNGEFDLGHIRGRAKLASQALPQQDRNVVERVEDLFSQLTHDDLMRPGFSLETVADVPKTYWDIYKHGMDATDWRYRQKELGIFDEDRPLDDPIISGSDIPYFGRELLNSTKGTTKYRTLYEMIYQYAVSDVEPLFELKSRNS